MDETHYIVNGFRFGFDLGYRGPVTRQDTASNIPFWGIGSHLELWEKLMKEVKLGRYVGLFEDIPFKRYVQSPIRLVPKSGNKTRLIFHLSYDFKEHKSINHYTPRELCTVKYNDLDMAVRLCLDLSQGNGVIYRSKTDLSSAFRMVPTNPKMRR